MDTRSRGGLASKIHAVVDGNGLPIQIASQAGKRTIIDLRPSSRHSRTPEQCAWPTVDMMPTGSEHSRVSMALGRTSRHDEIAMTRSASVHIYTAHATWSSGSSPRSSSAGARRRATTSSRRTTSPSSSLPWYAYSCALMSPRPSHHRLFPGLEDCPQARPGECNRWVVFPPIRILPSTRKFCCGAGMAVSDTGLAQAHN